MNDRWIFDAVQNLAELQQQQLALLQQIANTGEELRLNLEAIRLILEIKHHEH